MLKRIIISSVFVLAVVSTFAEETSKEVRAELKQDKEAVATACAEEAKIANCGDAKVGTGLLKCIHQYKKENRKEFKISDACKESMRRLKAHKMEMKEKHK